MNEKQTYEQLLGSLIRERKDVRAGRVVIAVNLSDIQSAVARLHADPSLRFITLSGIDRRNDIEMLYHFSDDVTGAVLTLRTYITDKKEAAIASISGIIRGATWIERELHELLGVNFIGNKNLKHLLLAEDWPKGNYPLRHDSNE